MKELLRSNDLVELSWAEALLTEAAIACFLFDQHTAVIEGSLGILPRRLMVLDEDLARAHRLLAEARLP